MSQCRNKKGKGHRGNGNRNDTRKKCRPGLLINRRNPGFCLITPYDVWLNMKERLYCWFNRVPNGSIILWTKDNKIRGHTTRAKRPYFG